MKISSKDFNINQLFSTSNEQFFIPAYQRRYAWSEKQLGELFDDVRLLKDSENHLLSTIVFLTDTFTVGINRMEVVDGQQRLITLSILFLVLFKKFKDLSDTENITEINKFLVSKDAKGNQQNKLLLGDLDNPDYENLVNNKFDKIKNQKILNAYKFYSDHLPQSKEELNLFYYKLKNNVYIIRLDVSLASDAYRLFESINNRGLRLSAADIIKNFLLGNASIINESTLKEVRENWKDLIIYLDGIIPDNFFRQYLMGLNGRKVPMSKLIEEFKEYYFNNVTESSLLSEYSLYSDESEVKNIEEEVEDKSIKSNYPEDYEDEETNNDETEDDESVETNKGLSNYKLDIVTFSGNLSSAADVYAKIVEGRFTNKKINRKLGNLKKIKSLPSYTFLLNVFQRNITDDEILEIIKMIETFMLRWHICVRRTSDLDDIFPKLVSLPNDNIVNNVKSELLKEIPSDNEFLDKLIKYNFKGNSKRAKYILEEIEYYIINDQGEYILTDGKELHLEHIIPQKIKTKKAKREYGDWVEYLGSEALIKHKEYVNRIGNFTLLAEKLNIVARNNPFLNKKREYKKSNIRLTQDLVNNYSRFFFKHVERRSKYLADIALIIWSIK